MDGLGNPLVERDLAVKGGRVSRVGKDLTGTANTTFDAGGLVLAPGIVDVHTHYDAQLTWDPKATPSAVLGVTTAGSLLSLLKPACLLLLRSRTVVGATSQAGEWQRVASAASVAAEAPAEALAEALDEDEGDERVDAEAPAKVEPFDEGDSGGSIAERVHARHSAPAEASAEAPAEALAEALNEDEGDE